MRWLLYYCCMYCCIYCCTSREKHTACIYSVTKQNCRNTPSRREPTKDNAQKEHLSIYKKSVLYCNVHISDGVPTSENLGITSLKQEMSYQLIFVMRSHNFFSRKSIVAKVWMDLFKTNFAATAENSVQQRQNWFSYKEGCSHWNM